MSLVPTNAILKFMTALFMLEEALHELRTTLAGLIFLRNIKANYIVTKVWTRSETWYQSMLEPVRVGRNRMHCRSEEEKKKKKERMKEKGCHAFVCPCSHISPFSSFPFFLFFLKVELSPSDRHK